MKKSQRITKSRDFQGVFSKGRGTRVGSLLLKARETGGPTRVAVIVSKKVAVKSTKRNRMRRVLAEALRGMLPLLKERREVVVVTLPGFQADTLGEARELLLGLLKKASLFK